jgi:hypothetical protein
MGQSQFYQSITDGVQQVTMIRDSFEEELMKEDYRKV